MRVLRSLLSQQIGSRNWMSAREGSCDRTIGRYSGSDSKASAIMSAQFYGKMHENSREQGQGDEQQLDGTRDISMSCWQVLLLVQNILCINSQVCCIAMKKEEQSSDVSNKAAVFQGKE
ncbi:uncharacterized protein LOC110600120 isoform X1 [Manihot esculenta]|uniref:uncharacterized protein LOC110600120 isoform X1 n=1 Tax=Manihot esculenta TaxID=3983 RepID=UPI001CC3FBC4|nr:uncharacterized protein LOC110600120 isoform X1 [Manihot esculenta]